MDIALDTCLDIFGKAYPEIKGLHGSESIEEHSENHASVRLVLFEENRRSSFAQVEVEVAKHQFEIGKEHLSIQVFAELSENEVEGLSAFTDADIESIFRDYANLKPLVHEGINHFIDDLRHRKNPKRKVSRDLKVRYATYDEEFEEDEDYTYNYDTDEIASATIPYLKSLLEIHSKYTTDLEPSESGSP